MATPPIASAVADATVAVARRFFRRRPRAPSPALFAAPAAAVCPHYIPAPQRGMRAEEGEPAGIPGRRMRRGRPGILCLMESAAAATRPSSRS